MSRRVRGAGSISRRKDGRWEGAAYLPTSSGAARRIRIYGKTAKEVSDKLSIKLADAKRGIPVPDRSWTVGAYIEYYMTTVAPKRLRPSTIELYGNLIRRHITPTLAAKSLTELSVTGLQETFDKQLNGGMTVSTAIQVKTILMAALTNAMREDLVVRNVARLIRLGDPGRKEARPWTSEEIAHFLTSIEGERMYPAYLIVAVYGMRRGEVLGLRWQDIDWDHDVIRVRQQVLRIGKKIVTGPLKTKKSRRDIRLLGPVRAALQKCQETTDSLGSRPADDLDLIFRSEKGLPVEPSYFADVMFHRLAERAGLRHVRMHDFRHSTATLLKNLGVPDKDIQAILGHARVTTTQEIYQHSDPVIQQRGLNRVEHVLLHGDGSSISRQLSPSNTLTDAYNTLWASVADLNVNSKYANIAYLLCRSADSSLTSVTGLIRASASTHIFGTLAVSLAVKSRQPNHARAALWQWISLRDALSTEPVSFIDRLAATTKER